MGNLFGVDWIINKKKYFFYLETVCGYLNKKIYSNEEHEFSSLQFSLND